MAERDLDKAFEAAAAIAKKLPKNLQEAAFNRALDHLLAARDSVTAPQSGQNPVSGKVEEQDTNWINQIDRTRHPDMDATSRIADQALKVLQLAHKDHRIDGLSAPFIARVLTDRFRLPVKSNAVAIALQRERGTVNPVKTRDGTVFRLTAPGERYLDELRSQDNTDSDAVPRRKSKSRAATRNETSGTSSRKPAASEPSTKASASEPRTKSTGATGSKRTGRPGPKAAIALLLSSGFFNSSRTISDVQRELKHKRGHTYTVQELAPALVRTLRDETLDRQRSENGQYEYVKA